jgi:hypothetical protein
MELDGTKRKRTSGNLEQNDPARYHRAPNEIPSAESPLPHQPSLIIHAKVAHHSAKRDGRPPSELRLAGHATIDYRSTRCRYGVRINDGASRASTAALAPYPMNAYPRPVTAPLTIALAGPVYSNTTRPFVAVGLRVPRADCSIRNCSRCPPQHDIGVPPIFTARGAPPPRALARRLRASLGPQAPSYEPRGDHAVPSRDVRRSSRIAPADNAGQRSSRSVDPPPSSRASGAAIQRLRQ